MLGLCLSRIIATLIHRAFFLLLADFFAGARWYLINNFTAFIDFALGTDYELFMSYQDMRFALTALGFAFAWWMVHFLDTKQMWFNGVAVELFLLTQVLGYLSNLAFTTNHPSYPLMVSVALFFLVDCYRFYMQQLRLLDPERIIYQFSQLKKPIVPHRALQLIQVTPLLYILLQKLQFYIHDSTFARLRYSLGMADALIYAGVNLDVALVLITRLYGTLAAACRDFSVTNFTWMFRVNITGSYTIMLRDIGWKSIPSDQLHLSWFIYWLLKIAIITVHWFQTSLIPLREPYFYFLTKELASSFVSATATVYFACLISGTILTSIASIFTCSSDAVPTSSFLKGTFDTVQHIRWNSFPRTVGPAFRVSLIMHAIMFGHVPLCGKMIQSVGQTVRRSCECDNQAWSRAVGGVLAILAYIVYSCTVVHFVSIQAPNVSECFSRSIRNMSAVWITYNFLITLVEIVTICVYQGLMTGDSRLHLERGTALFRASMTGVLGICLTFVNLMALHDSVIVNAGEVCGYKDVVHNSLQIVARVAFIYISVTEQSTEDTVQKLKEVASLTYHSVPVTSSEIPERDPCGLCYETGEGDGYIKLATCGHTFHDKCFRPWRNIGNRCPVCRAIFLRPDSYGSPAVSAASSADSLSE